MQHNIKDMINTDYKAPEIEGIYEWINSRGSLNLGSFRGKVVIVDFWTYTCINCIRTLPHLNRWYELYKQFGLEIIGVHTPEFEFEHNIINVKNAVSKYGIKYPVGLDNNYQTWKNYTNLYWPAKYIIDRQGLIRFSYFGEGNYEQIEEVIKYLLTENNGSLSIPLSNSGGKQTKNEVEFDKIYTSETYLGMDRMKTSRFFNAHDPIFINPVSGSFLGSDNQSVLSQPMNYQKPFNYNTLNTWRIEGVWKFSPQYLEVVMGKGLVGLKFKAKSVNLVVSGIEDGQQVGATIYLDGVCMENSEAGEDVKNGRVIFNQNRLYNLVDQSSYKESLIEIEFDQPGIYLYAWTFG